jgi:hypothetical protein
MRKVRVLASAAALSGLLGLVPASAFAQSADAPKQQVSASPFLIMYRYFNVEFERRATQSTSLTLPTFRIANVGRYVLV